MVTETVTEGVKMVENAPLVKDFNKEQEKFIAENKSSGKIKVPWKGYKDEEQLKEQILTLSKDKRNFLRAPPAGAQFEVNQAVLKTYLSNTCLTCLNLEIRFWSDFII